MKEKLLFILLTVMTTAVCFGQKKNEVRLYGGFVSSDADNDLLFGNYNHP